MTLHRVREPRRPAELSEFITWVEHMNTDMLAAGVELGDQEEFDVRSRPRLARRCRR